MSEQLRVAGTLIEIGEIQSGTSQAGKDWQKRFFVIETDGDYPKKIAFDLFGEEKVKSIDRIQKGGKLDVFFNVESREYNGKWYSNINCWKFDVLEAVGAAPDVPESTGQMPEVTIGDPGQDLPF